MSERASEPQHYWDDTVKATRTVCRFILLRLAILVIVIVPHQPVQSLPGPGQRNRADSSVSTERRRDVPPDFLDQFNVRVPPPRYVPKSPGHYSAQDWADAIDSTWGDGLSGAEKLAIWNDFWTTIDEEFACFHHLDDSGLWDSVFDRYNQEIVDGVSRGRFGAILLVSSRALRESHTRMRDTGVVNTQLLPGVPLLYCGNWGKADHLGAALTPLPDSTLLVYKAITDHPLGLVLGDVVLGYDGTLWKDLYLELFEAELPTTGSTWGSSEPSFTHSWLGGAGMNWHLFDSMDVVKYSTGDTVRLATNALSGREMSLWASEQLDVPGVPMPNFDSGQLVSWGIIESTSIGYIYGWGWAWNAQEEWYNAVDSLMHHCATSGLIVDFRLNFGGNMYLAYTGLELLFDSQVLTVGFGRRCNDYDHYAMCAVTPPGAVAIEGDSSTYYDKPIAVLIGPGAVSSGDQIALALSLHPMAKLFGKPTAAAFNAPALAPTHHDFRFLYALSDAFLATDPTFYLTHSVFPNPIDFPMIEYEEVWLTRDGVAQALDDVVQAAVAWIGTFDADGDGIADVDDNCPDQYNPLQVDSDSDGIGDTCDICPYDTTNDVDNDSICGSVDNCPDIYNPGQIDSDGDTIGDSCDVCPEVFDPDQVDTDGDGVGDACCCVDRGNADGDGGVNVADLTYLVDYLFFEGTSPPCPEEGNTDADGGINVADLTYLVDYLFFDGPTPAPCP